MTRPDAKPDDWSDLSQVWTTPEAAPPAAAADLERSMRRRALLATVNFHLEAWGAVIAGALSGWVAFRHDAPLLGAAGVAFAVFALIATVWARRGAVPGEAETPAAALAAAIRQARSGLRWARAGQAICVAALGFLVAVAFDAGALPTPWFFLPALAFLAVSAVFYERHARRAKARIAGHEAAMRDLDAPA